MTSWERKRVESLKVVSNVVFTPFLRKVFLKWHKAGLW